METTIGIISDTHGFLPAGVAELFSGVSHIVHAGDVGGMDILTALGRIAPVTAVRGNTDGGEWALKLRATEILEVADVQLYAIHDLAQMDLIPQDAGIKIVCSGHTHIAQIVDHDGVLYVNPGSISRPLHGSAPTVARIHLQNAVATAEIVKLPKMRL